MSDVESINGTVDQMPLEVTPTAEEKGKYFFRAFIADDGAWLGLYDNNGGLISFLPNHETDTLRINGQDVPIRPDQL